MAITTRIPEPDIGRGYAETYLTDYPGPAIRDNIRPAERIILRFTNFRLTFENIYNSIQDIRRYRVEIQEIQLRPDQFSYLRSQLRPGGNEMNFISNGGRAEDTIFGIPMEILRN